MRLTDVRSVAIDRRHFDGVAASAANRVPFCPRPAGTGKKSTGRGIISTVCGARRLVDPGAIRLRGFSGMTTEGTEHPVFVIPEGAGDRPTPEPTGGGSEGLQPFRLSNRRHSGGGA